MFAQLRPALMMIMLFTALTGFAYPLAITGIAQLVFPDKANGSIVERDGKAAGSALIGQNFISGRYFHPRPSATVAPDPADPAKTVDAPYNAANSSGSNLGPTSKKLVDRVSSAIEAEFQAGYSDAFAADAVTTSASGLDPHISPQFALAQVPSVAKAREPVRGARTGTRRREHGTALAWADRRIARECALAQHCPRCAKIGVSLTRSDACANARLRLRPPSRSGTVRLSSVLS